MEYIHVHAGRRRHFNDPMADFVRVGRPTKDPRQISGKFPNHFQLKFASVEDTYAELAILQASYTVGSKVYDIFDSLIARGAWNWRAPTAENDRNPTKWSKLWIVLDSLLAGGLEPLLLFDILGIIFPIDFHMFQRGWNHQPVWLYPVFFGDTHTALPEKNPMPQKIMIQHPMVKFAPCFF